MQHQRLSINGSRTHPNYAIVHLPEGTNVINFYQLLLENGFSEVSFVNEVRENAYLPLHSNVSTGDNGRNNNNRHTIYQQQIQLPTQVNNVRSDNGNGTGKNANPLPVLSMSNVLEGARALLRQHQQQQQLAVGVTNFQTQDGGVVQTAIPTQLSDSQCQIGVAPAQKILSRTKPILVSSNLVSLNTPSPAASASSSPSLNQKRTSVELMTTEVAAITTKNVSNNDIDEYAICLLCNNRLMSTRLSNLTNHVRRHAPMKQYCCRHCHYSHNEMAKVRLHMSHNHQDFDGQPVDQLTFEMQLQWGLLMEQCFPEHAKRFGPSAANSQFRCLDQLQKCVDLDRSYPCIECGELVQGYRLVNHLEETHSSDCAPSACGECGYESSSQWKVRLHISVKHPERAADVQVKQKAAGTNWMLFLHKFFSDVHITALEEEEANLVAELREKNTDFDEMLTNNDQNFDLLGNQVETKQNNSKLSSSFVEIEPQTEMNTKFTSVIDISPTNEQVNSNTKEKLRPLDKIQACISHTPDAKIQMMDQQQKTTDVDGLEKAEKHEEIMERNCEIMKTTDQQQRKNTTIERNLRKRTNDHGDDSNQTPMKRHNLRQSHRLMEQQKIKINN